MAAFILLDVIVIILGVMFIFSQLILPMFRTDLPIFWIFKRQKISELEKELEEEKIKRGQNALRARLVEERQQRKSEQSDFEGDSDD